MTTESTSTMREMPQELFDSFSAQFDALTKAIEDAGFPVLHTCVILRDESADSLTTSILSAVRNLQGDTAVQMAATAAAQPIMSGLTSALKDETGNIPAERLMQLLPLTKAVTDMFIPFFTQVMAAHTSQALKESGCSGAAQTEVLMSALMDAVENLQPRNKSH